MAVSVGVMVYRYYGDSDQENNAVDLINCKYDLIYKRDTKFYV